MYCAYLRKSRLDIEAERYSNTDTLERQKQILLDFAKRNNIPISKIYKEVVSGESIDARPEIQKLQVKPSEVNTYVKEIEYD